MAGMPRESLDDWIERHVALGLLVTAGARMEEILRECFCMLDGGEHADVVAAGQDVSWLIEYCGDLAEANPLITQASKDAIGAALTVCKAAGQHRNELIHGVHFFFGSTSLWASGWGWVHRSRRHKPELVKEWTLSEIHGVWRELCVATDEIDQAVSEAVGQRGALWARRARKAVDADGKPWPGW
jgi:hypothetical protein